GRASAGCRAVAAATLGHGQAAATAEQSYARRRVRRRCASVRHRPCATERPLRRVPGGPGVAPRCLAVLNQVLGVATEEAAVKTPQGHGRLWPAAGLPGDWGCGRRGGSFVPELGSEVSAWLGW